jgi:predicted nucleic-acid-binding protein
MPAYWRKQDAGMIAVDTNIVVRYLTNDHPEQSAKARALINGHDVFLCRTVILECEWVLRGVYRYSQGDICRVLRKFTGLATVLTEDHPVVAQALDFAENGMDFADALHLCGAPNCEIFATFDRDFVKRAEQGGVDKVSLP